VAAVVERVVGLEVDVDPPREVPPREEAPPRVEPHPRVLGPVCPMVVSSSMSERDESESRPATLLTLLEAEATLLSAASRTAGGMVGLVDIFVLEV
jgi:hypothetical protein